MGRHSEQPRTGDGRTSRGRKPKASEIVNNLPAPGKRGAARVPDGRAGRGRVGGWVNALIKGRHER